MFNPNVNILESFLFINYKRISTESVHHSIKFSSEYHLTFLRRRWSRTPYLVRDGRICHTSYMLWILKSLKRDVRQRQPASNPSKRQRRASIGRSSFPSRSSAIGRLEKYVDKVVFNHLPEHNVETFKLKVWVELGFEPLLEWVKPLISSISWMSSIWIYLLEMLILKGIAW